MTDTTGDSLEDIDPNFLLKPPYSDSVGGVISGVMIRVSGIKNKYGSPTVNPKEMNDELDIVFKKATQAINSLTTQARLDELMNYKAQPRQLSSEEVDYIFKRIAELKREAER